MHIYGLDFTSVPGRRKPITCAGAQLEGGRLSVETVERFNSFPEFEAFLHRPGPWRAGFDFPFGQPRRLLAEQRRGQEDWPTFVSWVAQRSGAAFAEWLTEYRRHRPYGDKQHRRETDRLASACSPMMLYGVPVAKMFHGGAPRLYAAGVSILPMCPRPDPRVAIEAYPKLVAARYAAGGKYKTDERRHQTTERKATRDRILDGLQAHVQEDFGFRLRLPRQIQASASEDPTGDTLDALLCSVQAAWSARCTMPPDGIPEGCDKFEGWIVDPQMLELKKGHSVAT